MIMTRPWQISFLTRKLRSIITIGWEKTGLGWFTHKLNSNLSDGRVMTNDREKEVEYLIERELKPEGITDERVVEAMYRVKREKFIPASLSDRAYGNYPLPIGENHRSHHKQSFHLLNGL